MDQVFARFIDQVARTVPYTVCDQIFQKVVHVSVLSDENEPTPHLPEEDFRQKIMNYDKLMSRIPDFIQSLKKEYRSIEEIFADQGLTIALTTDLVRSTFARDIARLCPVRAEHWRDQRNRITTIAASYGVKIDPTTYRAFLIDVKRRVEEISTSIEEKKRLVLELVERDFPIGYDAEHALRERLDRSKKAIVDLKDHPAFKAVEEPKEMRAKYVYLAASYVVEYAGGAASLQILTCYFLSVAESAIPRSEMVQLEYQLSTIVTLDIAAMNMPASEFRMFAAKLEDISKKLTDASGSILIHHDEDVDRGSIDVAARRFIQEHALFESMPTWTP